MKKGDAKQRRAIAQAFLPSEPHMPAPYSKPVAYAIKAMAVGEATPDQQQMALAWICNVVCGNNDLSYRPDSLGGERATVFADGKRFVGLQINKLVKLPIAELGLTET